MINQKSKALFLSILVLQTSEEILIQKDNKIEKVFFKMFFPLLLPYASPDTPSLKGYNQLFVLKWGEKEVE